MGDTLFGKKKSLEIQIFGWKGKKITQELFCALKTFNLGIPKEDHCLKVLSNLRQYHNL